MAEKGPLFGRVDNFQTSPSIPRFGENEKGGMPPEETGKPKARQKDVGFVHFAEFLPPGPAFCRFL